MQFSLSKIFLAAFVLFQSARLLSQNAGPAVLQKIQVDVVYLASDYLEGREPGAAGEILAGDYIAYRMGEAGLRPLGENGTWFQSFAYKERPNPHGPDAADGTGKEKTGRNVVGFLNNRAKTTVVIGAHYDHLGLGGHGSLHANEAAIHNGADDNASGIAALLRLAEALRGNKAARHNNYLFIAFSGEEDGLIGSKYWVNHPTLALDRINYMLNMDMVGRLRDDRVLIINGAGTSPAWKETLEKIALHGIIPKTTDSGVGPSDHTSFYLKDLPVLHFFTGQHTDYHKPGDDAHLVNFVGIQQVSDFLLALILRLNARGKLAFTKTKDNDDKKAADFKVTLGVMPDYAYSGEGMRIDAVLDGRPAQAAGLLGGDVVIQIGDLPVKDIYAYMDGLAKFKKGDKTTVKVKRGEEVIAKEVQF